MVLVRNDQFVGKRKLKDCWGDKVYTVCHQVDMEVPVYVIKNNEVEGKPFTEIDFLVERVDPEQDQQVAARLFKVASTLIGSEVPHQEKYKASTPTIEVQA